MMNVMTIIQTVYTKGEGFQDLLIGGGGATKSSRI